MNLNISQVQCSVNENDLLSMLLYERVETIIKSQNIEFVKTESYQSTLSISVINKESLSLKTQEFILEKELYCMSVKHRDLYLFLIMAQILDFLDSELLYHWVEIDMHEHIYFHTLLLALSQSLPILQKENDSFAVIHRILKIGIMKPSLFKKINLHVTLKYIEIELSKDLYEMIIFEFGDDLFTALESSYKISDKYEIPIKYKIDNDGSTNYFSFSINGYKVYFGVIFLDSYPAESTFNNSLTQDSPEMRWFSKEHYSIKRITQNGYIIYDYLTLIQKVQQRAFNTINICNNEESYESLYASQKIFLNNESTIQLVKNHSHFKYTNVISDNINPLSHNTSSLLTKKVIDNDLKPSAIEKKLNETVAGQTKAKKELSSIFYWHMLASKNDDIESLDSSLLLAGATGSGKTFLIQKLSDMFDLVFVHVDTSQLVPEGYRGRTVNNLIKEILRKSVYELQKAESCIIFFDECDKLDSKNEFDRAVINQLLRFIEGAEFPLSVDYYDEQDEFKEVSHIRTHKMLKVFAGSFYHQVKSNNSHVGFLSSSSKKVSNSTITEAFPAEFNGRISRKIILEKIGYKEIYHLLKKQNNDITKILKKIEYFGHNVSIDDSIYQEIAKDVENSPIGMRRIKHLAIELFSPLLSLAPEIKPTTFFLGQHDIDLAISKTI